MVGALLQWFLSVISNDDSLQSEKWVDSVLNYDLSRSVVDARTGLQGTCLKSRMVMLEHWIKDIEQVKMAPDEADSAWWGCTSSLVAVAPRLRVGTSWNCAATHALLFLRPGGKRLWLFLFQGRDQRLESRRRSFSS